MNQCSAVVIILTTGGVLLFFKRKLLKNDIFKMDLLKNWVMGDCMRSDDDGRIENVKIEVTDTKSESMDRIIKKAEELRNLISEASFDIEASDLSLTFISEDEETQTEFEEYNDEEKSSFPSDTPKLPSLKPKPWNIQKLWKLTELSYMSPDKSSHNLPALEWESPGQGWHHIQCYRDASDYGSLDSGLDDSGEEVSALDDSDQDLWEWDNVSSYTVDVNLSNQDGFNESVDKKSCGSLMSGPSKNYLRDSLSDNISPIVNHARYGRDRNNSCGVLTSSMNCTPDRD